MPTIARIGSIASQSLACIPATTVPAFRPGAAFRTAVSGAEQQASPRTAAAVAPAIAVTEQVDAVEKPGKRAQAKKDDRTAEKTEKSNKIEKTDKAAKAGKRAEKVEKAKDGKPRKGKKK